MCLAVPGRIVSVVGEGVTRAGRVDFGGLTKEVNLAFVPEAALGDYVLVHVGFAIGTVDEGEARRIVAELEQIDALEAQDPVGRSLV